MRVFAIFYFSLMILIQPIFSQEIYHLNDIQNVKIITWYGLDFSKGKLENDFKQPKEVRQAFLDGWNEYVCSPQANIKNLLEKEQLDVDLSIVTERNRNFNNSLETPTKEIIARVIRDYKISKTEGIGLVFIVDSFDKLQEKAFVWVTFFDIASKKVLLTEKVQGKTKRSASMVLHWGEAMLDIMSKVPGFYKTYQQVK
jgi:hypothetical protein